MPRTSFAAENRTSTSLSNDVIPPSGTEQTNEQGISLDEVEDWLNQP